MATDDRELKAVSLQSKEKNAIVNKEKSLSKKNAGRITPMSHPKREIQYDILRSTAVVAIIFVHAIPAQSLNPAQRWFSAAVTPLLLAFVGIYFMLSGLFLLKPGTEPISEFYRKRFRTVVFPFISASFLYYWYYELYLGNAGVSLAAHILAFFKDFVTGTVPGAPHLWFLYVLLAFYLFTPFLARMFQAVSDREFKFFLVLVLGLQALHTYLPALGIGIGESFGYILYPGWFVYFVLGYGCKRLFGNASYLPFGVLGLVGFSITMVQKWFFPSFQPGIHDLAPTMTAMSVAIFQAFEHIPFQKQGWLARAGVFISKYSRQVYLLHYLVLGQVVKGWMERSPVRHYYLPKILCETGVTFVICLGVAWGLDKAAEGLKRLKSATKAIR